MLLLVLLAFAASAGAQFPRRVISLSGRVGKLHFGFSTERDVIRAIGAPQHTAEDNFHLGAYTPEYRALGYQCGRAAPYRRRLTYYGHHGPYCRTIYYVNLESGVLGSFWTTSHIYRTAHGTTIGMGQRDASRREHKPATGGCFDGISERSRAIALEIEIVGSHYQRRTGHIVGGYVYSFSIDSRSEGLGLLFC